MTDMVAALVVGFAIALFLSVSVIVLIVAFCWHLYRHHWDLLTRKIEKTSQIGKKEHGD